MTTDAMETGLSEVRSFDRKGSSLDGTVKIVTRAAAWLVLALLVGIGLSLLLGSWTAIVKFGPAFLWTDAWNPVKENFGGLVPIFGTLLSVLIVGETFQLYQALALVLVLGGIALAEYSGRKMAMIPPPRRAEQQEGAA